MTRRPTPGPWAFSPRLSASENHRGYNVGVDGGYFLAHVMPLDEDGIEGCANARLMAAAPDLLAALEELATEADQALAYISTRTDADARAAQLEGTLMQAIDASRATAEQARSEEPA